ELLCIYKSTGEIVWSYSTEGIINTVPLPSPDYVYVTSWDKNLHVVNRLSGQLVFKYELKRPVKSSPIIYRDYLLLHLANDQLLALANEKIVNERRVQP
ncbi:MAG: PQQ-binding-like beta-propeller repeat protein, partial [Calditrichota bacterium]